MNKFWNTRNKFSVALLGSTPDGRAALAELETALADMEINVDLNEIEFTRSKPPIASYFNKHKVCLPDERGSYQACSNEADVARVKEWCVKNNAQTFSFEDCELEDSSCEEEFLFALADGELLIYTPGQGPAADSSWWVFGV